MSATQTTTNLGLPQFQSSDYPTWDDINGAFAIIDVLAGAIAPKFNAASTYAKGDIVQYEGGLYKANKSHTGQWSASDFDAIIIANNLEQTDLTNFVKYDSQAANGLTAAQYAKLVVNS
jgi:hypothetical protein